jgi:hypothetical protein
MAADMVDLLYARRDELKGIALVNGLKAIRDIAMQQAAEPDPDPEDDPTRSLLDKIDALPAPHAAKLLDKEIERLETELADHVAKREQLKGHL